jgi:hypothetical protein
MSERRDASKGKKATSPRRDRTHAATIKRQQKIAHLHDVERLTWAEIAETLKMGQKEARESYRRYHADIVPLLIGPPAPEKTAELLGELEEVRQRQFRIARTGNDNAKVGALRDLVKTILAEYEIRRGQGLLPKIDGDPELQLLAKRIVEVLGRHDVAPEATEEILQLFDPDPGTDETP